MTGEERIPEDCSPSRVALADRTDGDIDTLANRIGISGPELRLERANWLRDPDIGSRTRAIETAFPMRSTSS